MRLLINYIGILTILLMSCNNTNNQKFILRIDSLNMQLETAVEEYSIIDSTTLANIRKDVSSNCNKIDYKVDSSFNKLIIPYSQINKSIKQILKMDFYIKTELQKSRIQINTLLHDADRSLIDTTLLMQYIEDEKKAVNILIERMNFNHLRMMSETKRYDSLNPLIEEFINKNN